MNFIRASLTLAAAFAPLAAQWANHPTPGIPRTKDGKPNLAASAPKTADGKPDLSGLWETEREYFLKYAMNIAADMPPGAVQPWAESLYRQRSPDLAKDYPGSRCLPGPRMGATGLSKIIQLPNLVLILYEDSDINWRQIYMDGRTLPEDPQPTWMGYSVGRWEGDTLVVESNGFNDLTWLDGGGHPHTEALRMTERFRRRDFGHLDVQITYDDPKTFTRPLTIPAHKQLTPDTELIEAVCSENERDVRHMVGK